MREERRGRRSRRRRDQNRNLEKAGEKGDTDSVRKRLNPV
jgi:hypothetical protein